MHCRQVSSYYTSTVMSCKDTADLLSLEEGVEVREG